MNRPPITIYTASWCGYCQRAKRLLREKNLAFTEIDVESAPGLREEMMSRSQRRTVPQVFIGERHIGGSDELLELERSGELDRITQGD
ncbi:MAG: glutaredoxin 3 [Steroidobacterales bacterium]